MYRLFTFCIRRVPRIRISGSISVAALYSTESAQPQTFTGVKDRYNGITINTLEEKYDLQNFSKKLEESLGSWASDGYRCIWFKVHIKDSYCVPLLAQKGFTFHHARDDYVMMYKWLPEGTEPNLPPPCHTNLGVGAMVFNKSNQILAITEKHYEYPHWKLPGGYVERGEDIIDAAIREVKEETDVDAAFESLVTFRHTHNMMYGNSDIYVILMMKAITEEINISQREVKVCQWMDVNEYTTHPHVHNFNRLIATTALDYRKSNIKLDLKKKTVTWGGKYVRDMNYLMLSRFH